MTQYLPYASAPTQGYLSLARRLPAGANLRRRNRRRRGLEYGTYRDERCARRPSARRRRGRARRTVRRDPRARRALRGYGVSILGVAAPFAVGVLLWGRRRVLAAIAGVLTAVLIAVQVPWYVSAAPAPRAVAVRTMTVNMLYGHADASTISRVAAESADIVFVQELTPEAAKRLKAVGIDRTFPYQAIDARPMAAGGAVYSRYPMTDHRNVNGFQLALVTAQLQVVGVQSPSRGGSPRRPVAKPIEGWHADYAVLPSWLTDLATQAGQAPIILGGDFNSTIDMESFRQLLTNGYRDSAEQAGAGRQFTYPSNKRYPPLIGIDHILTRNATAVTTSTVKVPKTDHRALLATVMVPRG